jgi:hypothetical protein
MPSKYPAGEMNISRHPDYKYSKKLLEILPENYF